MSDEGQVEMKLDESQDSSGSESTRPMIELFVKASTIDKERKGSCPICQQWFMVFYILSEQRYIDLLVTTIVPENPPKEFSDLGTSGRLPDILVRKGHDPAGVDISNLVCDTSDEIEMFMDRFACPDLISSRRARESKASRRVGMAEAAFADLYKNFNALLKTGASHALESSLAKLNSYLEKCETKFMLGDSLSYADCQLLPKLQHLRIAGEEYRGYQIPEKFTHIWSYLENAYAVEAFRISCPADNDIKKHYEGKATVMPRTGNPAIQGTTYTFTVPNPKLEADVNGADD